LLGNRYSKKSGHTDTHRHKKLSLHIQNGNFTCYWWEKVVRKCG